MENTEAKQYQRKKLVLRLASEFLTLCYLCFMALAGGLWLDQLVEPWAYGSRWLQLIEFTILLFAGAELLTLPLGFWKEYLVEHEYQLSNETIAGWAWKQLKVWLLVGVIGLTLVAGLYAILWTVSNWWWVVASLGYFLFAVVLGILAPVVIAPMFYKLSRVEDQSLIDRLKRLAEGTGVCIEEVLRIHLSKETKKANAALGGFGKTKRVMMGDTLLDGFTPEEIEVVFAHELGHHVHRHVLKHLLEIIIVSSTGFFLCDLLVRSLAASAGHASFTAVSAMPIFMLVLSVFGLLVMPLENAVSRYFEGQSDWYALERTKNPQAYKAAFQRLAEVNKADMHPSWLTVVLFYDHPPIAERLAMADKWALARKPPLD